MGSVEGLRCVEMLLVPFWGLGPCSDAIQPRENGSSPFCEHNFSMPPCAAAARNETHLNQTTGGWINLLRVATEKWTGGAEIFERAWLHIHQGGNWNPTSGRTIESVTQFY